MENENMKTREVAVEKLSDIEIRALLYDLVPHISNFNILNGELNRRKNAAQLQVKQEIPSVEELEAQVAKDEEEEKTKDIPNEGEGEVWVVA